MTDPQAIIVELAASAAGSSERWADVVWILLTTAPHDPAIAHELDDGTAIYRGAVNATAERLAELGALRPGITPARAGEVLWFYFGYGAALITHNQLGWSYEESAQWLAKQAISDLLPPTATANTRKRRTRADAEPAS